MQVNLKGNCLLKELPMIYEDENCADVTFVCRDRKIVKAHKVLLVSVSSLLRDIFAEQNSPTTEVFLPDYSSSDLDNVLRYIYEGVLRLQKEELTQFKELCNELQLECPIVANLVRDDGEELVEEWHFQNTQNPSKYSLGNYVEQKRKAEAPVPLKILKTNCVRNNDMSYLHAKTSTASLKTVEHSSPSAKAFTNPIPLKHFKNFVCKVERVKAEKRMYKIVEEVVEEKLAKRGESSISLKCLSKNEMNNCVGENVICTTRESSCKSVAENLCATHTAGGTLHLSHTHASLLSCKQEKGECLPSQTLHSDNGPSIAPKG